jgi:Glycosyl transferase family 2.
MKKKNNALISRNIGAVQAKGNFIAFLDDDDFWHKNYLFDAHEVLKKKKNDIIIYNTFDFFNKKKIKKNKKIPFVFKIDDYLHYNPGIVCSNVIIKKKTFLDLEGYDLKISGGADKDLFIKGVLSKKKYFISSKRYVYLQNHPEQWSKKHKLILLQKILFFKKYFKYYLDLKNFSKFIKMILKFMLLIINKK